jgi:hypothetical protein
MKFSVRHQLSGIVILSVLLCAVNCYAAVISSNELIEKAKEFNGRKISYRGELITAILDRGEYSWINLNDGSNAIGVWCKTSMLDDVRFIGDYKNRGDIIEVNGTFNRACSVHDGELDIHADTVNIIKSGYSFIRVVDQKRIGSAVALFASVILIVIIFRKRL